jgi:hypothetical protein
MKIRNLRLLRVLVKPRVPCFFGMPPGAALIATHTATAILAANPHSVFWRVFMPMPAMRGVAPLIPSPKRTPLPDGIGSVICPSSKEQVRWIYAWRVVAFVAHLHSSWYRSIVKLIGDAVRQAHRIVVVDGSVAVWRHTVPSPYPASIDFPNFLQKTLNCWSYAHNQNCNRI